MPILDRLTTCQRFRLILAGKESRREHAREIHREACPKPRENRALLSNALLGVYSVQPNPGGNSTCWRQAAVVVLDRRFAMYRNFIFVYRCPQERKELCLEVSFV